MSLYEFFGRSAATRCFSVRAVQLPRCFSCGQGRAAPLLLFVRAVQLFLSFRGNRLLAVPGGWTSPPHCELRTILLTALFRYRFQSQRFLHSAKLIFTELLQRRVLYDIFVYARQGPFCPFTFPYFSRETTFLASAFGGLRESHPLSLHPRARFFLKRKKKEEKETATFFNFQNSKFSNSERPGIRKFQ